MRVHDGLLDCFAHKAEMTAGHRHWEVATADVQGDLAFVGVVALAGGVMVCPISIANFALQVEQATAAE